MKKDIIMSNIVSMETIVSKIYMIRGLKVMLDRDIAELYGVETTQKSGKKKHWSLSFWFYVRTYKKGVGVLEVPNWHLQ